MLEKKLKKMKSKSQIIKEEERRNFIANIEHQDWLRRQAKAEKIRSRILGGKSN